MEEDMHANQMKCTGLDPDGFTAQFRLSGEI